MLNTPFSPWPSFSQEEADAVARVLLSNKVNYWTGPEGVEFEKEFAAWCGAPHAVSLSNGTVALELAQRVLGIGPGDEVIVTPRTFMASAGSIVAVGATPVFADVDADSQNITAETAAQAISSRTKAIIAVHLAGWPCEMNELNALAREHSLAVIEDCAQAHGALYRGRSVGALGNVAAWSFCQDKIVSTAGEGGMLTTADPALWSRAWSYRDHGKSFEAVHRRKHPTGFRWVNESFGTNWRMIEIQAAVGRIQLRRMTDWHVARKANASKILAACQQCSALRTPEPPMHIEHAFYRVSAFVRPEALASGWSRDRIIEEVNSAGVPCYSGICPEIYLEKAFDGTSWRPVRRLPVAQRLGDTSLTFLVHPTLKATDIEKTCRVIQETMRRAQR